MYITYGNYSEKLLNIVRLEPTHVLYVIQTTALIWQTFKLIKLWYTLQCGVNNFTLS